jgi:hypothetical protein
LKYSRVWFLCYTQRSQILERREDERIIRVDARSLRIGGPDTIIRRVHCLSRVVQSSKMLGGS